MRNPNIFIGLIKKFTRGFLVLNFSQKVKIKTKINGYQKTFGKIIV